MFVVNVKAGLEVTALHTGLAGPEVLRAPERCL